MSWYELLYRKFEIMFLNKKYCNYKASHGHDMVFLYKGGKSYYTYQLFECSVCKRRFILDGTGFFEKV